MTDKKFLTSAIFIAFIATAGFLFWFIPRYSSHAIQATKDCADIFTIKNSGYFPEGKSRFVFNKNINSCLLFNALEGTVDSPERFVVVDMISDKILFYWELKAGEEKDANLSLTREEALDRVRAFSFIVF
jgi:hypothetical protein